MKKLFNKIFGGLNMSWRNVIIFAVAIGIYTGLINEVEFLKDTSLRDLAIYFDRWILFAIIIMTNTKSSKESALKTFVFFLISQPLVFLTESFFQGFYVFQHYPHWFVTTLFTPIMAYFGYYLKEHNYKSLILITPMIGLILYTEYTYSYSFIYSMPHHIYSYIFCIVTSFTYLYTFIDNKLLRRISLAVLFVLTAIVGYKGFTNNYTYETTIVCSNSRLPINENWQAELENNNLGTLTITKYDNDYCINAKFVKIGKTNIILKDENNKEYKYYIDIKNNTYDTNIKD